MPFKGNSATELNIDTTVTAGSGAGTTNNNKSYGTLASDKFSYFGLVNTISTFGFSFVTTTTFTPPITTPLNLSAGGTYTYTTTQHTEVAGGGTTVPDVTQTVTVTYVGAESITVPAGTFNTCKIKTDSTINGTTTSGLSWTVNEGRYKGLFAKSDDGKGNVVEATKLLFNGS